MQRSIDLPSSWLVKKDSRLGLRGRNSCRLASLSSPKSTARMATAGLVSGSDTNTAMFA